MGISDGVFNAFFTGYTVLFMALLFRIFNCLRDRVLLAASICSLTLGLVARFMPSAASSIREVRIVLCFLATVGSLSLLITSFQVSKAADRYSANSALLCFVVAITC